MKKLFYIRICIALGFGFTIFSSSYSQPPGEWTWMQGSDTITNAAGVFGTKGVADPANSPPGFYEPVEWTDKQGNFWLFTGFNGGIAFGVYGDVWKFNSSALEWTWMHGTGTPNPPVVLGTQGVSSPLNSPGGFQWCGATWVDSSGNFWLFGGSDGGGASFSLLWKYDPVINEWTWVNGPTTNGAPGVFGIQGVPDPANYPTARWETNATWTDNNNNLWLYGGLNAPGDYLWKYDISINQWTWIKGSAAGGTPVYGTLGISSPTNTPGSRQVYAKWKDSNGDLWMYGGSGGFDDLWKYVISTNEWTWMGGSNILNDPGNYGPKCNSSTGYLPSARFEDRACWFDNGNFWVFGGYTNSSVYNDLWKYCVSTNEWTWINGDQSPNASGVYGTKGISSPLNIPGARMGSLGWKDGSGNLWMFGGWVGISQAANDLWRFVPDPACGLCSSIPVALFNAPNHICPGTCTDFNNVSINANSYLWTFSGANPSFSTDVNPTNICYNNPGSYTVSLIATNTFGSDTLTLNNFIDVYPYPPPQGIVQSGDTLFANPGAVSYQWYQDGNIIQGATDYFYVALSSGDYNVIATDNNGCEVEAVVFDVIAQIQSPAGNEQLEIFPDPVMEMLYVKRYLLSGSATAEFSIFNVIGEKIVGTSLLTFGKEQNGEIDCKQLSSGIYILEINSGNSVYRTNFVKQ